MAGVVGQLTVDSGFSASDMISLVLGFHNVNVNSAPQLTLPVVVDQFGSYIYQGGNYGDIEFPAQPQDHTTIDQFLGLISSDDDTYSGGKLPAPSTVTVAVLNGSGAYNQATDTANSLQALGFKIGTIGDSPPVGREAETVVYYSSKTPAELAAAQAVANSMSGSVIMADDPTHVKPGSQVTVVTGTQFSVNAPPTTTTPTSVGGAAATPVSPTTTTTTSPSTTGNGAFAPPTATVEPLQPWDPRRARRAVARAPERAEVPAQPLDDRGAAAQAKISPPFVSSACPVMARDRSEARYTMAPATSSSLGIRPSGTLLSSSTTTWDGTPRPVDVISM